MDHAHRGRSTGPAGHRPATPRLRLAALLLASLGAAPMGAVARDRAAPAPAGGIVLRFLGNEGFAIEAGGRTVLVDALQKVGTAAHGDLPADVFAKLLAGRPPFAQVPLVLVSHAHADHHVPSTAAQFLRRHAEASLVSSAEVLDGLAAEAGAAALQPRLVEVRTRPEAGVTHAAGGIGVEFFELPHVAPEMFPGKVLAHVVTMGGRKVLHVGDAELRADRLAMLGWATRGLDVAILPWWVFQQDGAEELIQRHVKARHVVAMRLPQGGLAAAKKAISARFPQVIFLTAPMETARF